MVLSLSPALATPQNKSEWMSAEAQLQVKSAGRRPRRGEHSEFRFLRARGGGRGTWVPQRCARRKRAHSRSCRDAASIVGGLPWVLARLVAWGSALYTSLTEYKKGSAAKQTRRRTAARYVQSPRRGCGVNVWRWSATGGCFTVRNAFRDAPAVNTKNIVLCAYLMLSVMRLFALSHSGYGASFLETRRRCVFRSITLCAALENVARSVATAVSAEAGMFSLSRSYVLACENGGNTVA